MTAPYTGGLLGKFFGDHDAAGGLIPEDLLRQMHRKALFAAGLGMLQPKDGQTGLAAIAGGLEQGQKSFDAGLPGVHEAGILAQRKAIAEKYPTVEGETPAQKVQRLTSMAVDYAQGGDGETAAKLVQTANALRLAAGAKPRYFQQNGKVTRVDPDGTITDIIDDGSLAAKQELAKANLELRKESVGQSGQRIMQRQGMAFYTRNKKIIDWGHALNQAITTISDARGNKYLTSSTIANFVQAADQNARLQIQMLNYFKENIDPSFVGKWENWKQRALTGQYSPMVYTKLLEHLKHLQGLAKKEYDDQRNGEIKNHADVEPYILDSDAAMSLDDNPGAAVPATDNPIDRF